jgi:hypothetical protein
MLTIQLSTYRSLAANIHTEVSAERKLEVPLA